MMKMSTRYKFSAEEIAEIQEARRKNTDKRVERRLKAIEMRALGQSLEDVGHACEYHPSYITTLVAKYRDGGLAALVSLLRWRCMAQGRYPSDSGEYTLVFYSAVYSGNESH